MHTVVLPRRMHEPLNMALQRDCRVPPCADAARFAAEPRYGDVVLCWVGFAGLGLQM